MDSPVLLDGEEFARFFPTTRFSGVTFAATRSPRS